MSLELFNSSHEEEEMAVAAAMFAVIWIASKQYNMHRKQKSDRRGKARQLEGMESVTKTGIGVGIGQ